MIEGVIVRLEERVPDLRGRTAAAADLAALMAANALPQAPVAAHVLPVALQGGRESSATALFIQDLEEVVGVLLTFRAVGRTGGQELARVRDIIRQVVEAVAGWGPDEVPGVFRLARGGMVRMSGGTLVYQLDFAITDQLRIRP
uniref:DUF3168 domain-containing protein n=1 Tax=Cereibacter sphaeroides (strain ATCC 17025 / ATH 2.4.3) TaxID=349102 RepID=A4WS44_CERS5